MATVGNDLPAVFKQKTKTKHKIKWQEGLDCGQTKTETKYKIGWPEALDWQS